MFSLESIVEGLTARVITVGKLLNKTREDSKDKILWFPSILRLQIKLKPFYFNNFLFCDERAAKR